MYSRDSAGSPAHPPARNMAPSNSLRGGMRSLEIPQPRQENPKGPPEAPPPCPRTTAPHPKTMDREPPAHCPGPTPPAELLPSARAAKNHLSCQCVRKKSTTEGAGRLKAGSPSLKSGSATARTLHRLDRPPVSPLPWPKKFPTPFPQTVFLEYRYTTMRAIVGSDHLLPYVSYIVVLCNTWTDQSINICHEDSKKFKFSLDYKICEIKDIIHINW